MRTRTSRDDCGDVDRGRSDVERPDAATPRHHRHTDTANTDDAPHGGDQRSGSEQTVTITGCIQQNSATGATGTGSAGATAGSSAAGGAGMSGSNHSRPANFVLANAKMAQGSSTSGLGTATRFSLIGMSDAELSKHVNHQVEVTGRVTGTSASGMSGGHGGAATEPPARREHRCGHDGRDRIRWRDRDDRTQRSRDGLGRGHDRRAAAACDEPQDDLRNLPGAAVDFGVRLAACRRAALTST